MPEQTTSSVTRLESFCDKGEYEASTTNPCLPVSCGGRQVFFEGVTKMSNKKSRKQLYRSIADSFLPPRYMYGRKRGEKASIRFILSPRKTSYDRRRRKQLRRLGYSVRIWSPSVEPTTATGFWGEFGDVAADFLCGLLFGYEIS